MGALENRYRLGSTSFKCISRELIFYYKIETFSLDTLSTSFLPSVDSLLKFTKQNHEQQIANKSPVRHAYSYLLLYLV